MKFFFLFLLLSSFIIFCSTFVVSEGRYVVVESSIFKKKIFDRPGIYFRIPWVEKIIFLDKRADYWVSGEIGGSNKEISLVVFWSEAITDSPMAVRSCIDSMRSMAELSGDLKLLRAKLVRGCFEKTQRKLIDFFVIQNF